MKLVRLFLWLQIDGANETSNWIAIQRSGPGNFPVAPPDAVVQEFDGAVTTRYNVGDVVTITSVVDNPTNLRWIFIGDPTLTPTVPSAAFDDSAWTRIGKAEQANLVWDELDADQRSTLHLDETPRVIPSGSLVVDNVGISPDSVVAFYISVGTIQDTQEYVVSNSTVIPAGSLPFGARDRDRSGIDYEQINLLRGATLPLPVNTTGGASHVLFENLDEFTLVDNVAFEGSITVDLLSDFIDITSVDYTLVVTSVLNTDGTAFIGPCGCSCWNLI